MRRRAKPARAKVQGERPPTRKSPATDDARVRDLEKRLAAAQKGKAEALARQTATSEILRVISSSPTEVQPVFEAIADSAMHVFDAEGASVGQYDGELMSVAARGGAPGSAATTTERLGAPHRPIAGFPPEQTVLTKTMHHIADVDTDPSCSDEFRRHATERGFRSVLSMPMLRGGDPVGLIAVSRAQPGAFSTAEIELLHTFADQAVIAIENVRLFKELEARNADLTVTLDRQTATSEILKVISRSPTEMRPVFETIVDSAVTLCDAASGALFRYDGELVTIGAHGSRVGPDERAILEQIFPRRLGPESRLVGRAIREKRVVHIDDLQADAEVLAHGQNRRLVEAQGFRTFLAVPLLRGDVCFGVINLYRRVVAPFSEQHIALLQTFADQAVIAIENVRLFTELQEKNRALTEALDQQTATADILRVISSSPTDLQPVLNAVATNAARVCAAYDATVLLREDDLVRRVAHHGPMPSQARAARPISSGFLSNRAILDRKPVHVHDILATEGADFADAREGAARLGERTILAVPLLREDAAIGALTIRRREVQPFTDKQIALLQTFADQAVIAIENVRLFTELQEKNRALTEAHGEVTAALEQQTATSEILRTIAQAQTDVQPVFDTIVQSAARLCHATNAAVFLTDGRMVYHPANYGSAPDALAVARARFPRPLDMDSVPGMVILTRSVVHVPDIEESSPGPLVREVGRLLGFRSTVAVPMLREGEAIGSINVARREPGRFSDAEVALLKTFADQAVIAIENVRLFTELQEKNRALTAAHAQVTEALDQQTATSEILRTIARAQTDVQPVFDSIVQSAARLCRAAIAGVFVTDGRMVYHPANYGSTPEALAAARARYPRRLDRETMPGMAILARAVVHVSDTEEPSASEHVRDVGRMLDFRSVVSVPMLREGEAVGAIAVSRREPGRFWDAEVQLLQTFADQAVIAIENVRLFKELETRNRDLTEALDQQTATSEILRAISSSPTNEQAVFDAIVRSAVRLCRAATAAVFRVDAGVVYEPANYGSSPERLAATRARYPRPLDTETPPGVAILTRSVFHVSDTEDPSTIAHVRQTGRLLGVRSVISVPMLRESEAVGALVITRHDPGRFSDAEIALLKTFADQAVIAVENVRLFKELEARTAALTRSVEQLTALGEVGRAVSSTLDLATVLTTIVSRAVELSRLDGGVVFEYDEGAEEFIHRAATETGGALAEARRATRVRKGEGVVGRTAITLEPAQVPDITIPGAHESRLRENLIESGIRAVLAVPMVRESRLIGSLVVSRNRPGAFPAQTIELLKTFATQSALAIQNARLFQEIAEKSRQLEAASRHKSEFLANMSHELRTPLNAVIGFSEVLLQRMFGALTDKQDEYLKDIYASGQHLLSLINDILDLSKIEAGRMELAPALFHLPSALDNAVTLVKGRADRHGIALQVDIDRQLGELVGDERKVKQVVLNLLANAVKFTAEGGRISLTARRRDGAVEIAVTDTGVGIAPEDQAAIFEEFRQVGSDARKQEGTGLGLTLAKKFVELHGGRIWVDSAVGRGATFTFTLPMP